MFSRDLVSTEIATALHFIGNSPEKHLMQCKCFCLFKYMVMGSHMLYIAGEWLRMISVLSTYVYVHVRYMYIKFY